MHKIQERRGFVTFLSLIFSIAIICFLMYTMLNSYFKKPTVDKGTSEALSSQKIDSSSYQSLVNSTKSRLNEMSQDRSRQFEELSQ